MATQDDLTRAIEQIRFARWYAAELLSDIPVAEWFTIPAGAGTHVAWQVGHLAFAQHAMCMLRLRVEQPGDEQLIPAALRKLFGRGSVPSADSAVYPPPTEIRSLFDRVHEHVLSELSGLDPADLDQPAGKPHRFARTKLDCITWCSRHELVHAGQIALLRRLLGKEPQW